jgi:hypothetical protein
MRFMLTGTRYSRRSWHAGSFTSSSSIGEGICTHAMFRGWILSLARHGVRPAPRALTRVQPAEPGMISTGTVPVIYEAAFRREA